jgi:hypothetical protein
LSRHNGTVDTEKDKTHTSNVSEKAPAEEQGVVTELAIGAHVKTPESSTLELEPQQQQQQQQQQQPSGTETL